MLPNDLKKQFSNVQKKYQNRLFCTAVPDQWIHIIISKTVSNDSQKVSTMCDI